MKKEFVEEVSFKGKTYLVEMCEGQSYINRIWLIAKDGKLHKRDGNDFVDLAQEINKKRGD